MYSIASKISRFLVLNISDDESEKHMFTSDLLPDKCGNER